MSSWPYGDDRVRAMYRGGRADATARRLARMWATVFGLGLMPRRWVTLEVAGRRSGRVVRFPLGMADTGGEWYLVPMLGEQCNWVRNVRAAGGQVTLRHGRATACRLAEVPVSERAPIIKRYLEQVPGARPHIPVDRHAPVADFEAIAPRYPVYRVVPRQAPDRPARKRHWVRWVLGGAVALVAVTVLAVGLIVEVPSAPAPLSLPRGATVTLTCADRLTMHGVSHPVTFTIRARRDGTALQAAGTIPVTFGAWGIKGPVGYGLFGALADHGVAEFLVVLRHTGSGRIG